MTLRSCKISAASMLGANLEADGFSDLPCSVQARGEAVGVCTSPEQPVVFPGTRQRRSLLSRLSLWSFLAQKEDAITEQLLTQHAWFVTDHRDDGRDFTTGIRSRVSNSCLET